MFSQLFARSQSVLERARACQCEDRQLIAEAQELRDMLWGRMQHYVSVLREAGFTLPYDRLAWPK